MSGTTYTANFDDSAFAAYENTDSTRLSADACAIKLRNNDNEKKLKFITTNNIDLIESADKLNFFAIGLQDQLFVPSDKIDHYSNLLNGQNGGELTSKNERRGINFGMLPLKTLPFRGQISHGNVDIEDSIRNNLEPQSKACNPKDTQFYSRSFYIFDDKLNIETPLATRSVEKPEDGFAFGRMGIPSRYCNRFK
jgi:hypothetical protein